MEWLIEVTGLPFDILILILLAIAGAFAGFVDSIVGGGGLISVPAMLLTNLPPSMALGSNKLSSIFGAGSASITTFYIYRIHAWYLSGCIIATLVCKAYYYRPTRLCHTFCGI